jgi:TetR/AcrR family transcriptional repressor of nem operon
MPYTKGHKDHTRKLILGSAFQLFTAKGFDQVTVNEIMENCNLTRGAFYAHFSSKSALYSESITFSSATSRLTEPKPKNISEKIWLRQLLDGYLSIEHVNGERACPLAFLATDVATRDMDAKLAYSKAYFGFNEIIMTYANCYTTCDEDEILSLTAMIIGAVSISRTMESQKDIKKILSSCRRESGIKLGKI